MPAVTMLTILRRKHHPEYCGEGVSLAFQGAEGLASRLARAQVIAYSELRRERLQRDPNELTLQHLEDCTHTLTSRCLLTKVCLT